MVDTAVMTDILARVNCGLGTKDNEHLCEQPLVLSCGHHICKSCLLPGINHRTIKCNICNQTNKNDLNLNQKTESFDDILNTNLNKLFDYVSQKFQTTLKTCKDMVDSNNSIDSHVDFMRDEIFISFESIKIELDSIYESFCRELDEIQEKWKEKSTSLQQSTDFELKQFEKELNKLEENIKKQENLNKESLFYYENQIKFMKDTMVEFNTNTPKLTFKEGNFQQIVNKNAIGNLLFEPNQDRFIINKVQRKNYKKFVIPKYISDFTMLPNGNFLLVGHTLSEIFLYNNKLSHLRTIKSINNQKVKIACATTDPNNNIFLTDGLNHRVIKTDLELNELATFGDGKGSGSNKLNGPFGVCYYNGHIYVCDNDNKRIQKFDTNLELKDSLKFNFEPLYIKNIDNVAICRVNADNSIYFVDLDTGKVLKRYDPSTTKDLGYMDHNGTVGASRTCFYEYHPPDFMLHVYDKKGELIKTIRTDSFGIPSVNNVGSIAVYRSKLYLQISNSPFMIVV